MKNYRELIGKYKKKNCFILGAGPSLYNSMIDKNFNNILSKGVVIVVNSAILAYKDADVWISNDSLCRHWDYFSGLKKNKCIKVVRNSWLKYKDEIKDFYIFEPRKTSEGIIDPLDYGLCFCSSVPTSIDFAIKCRFSNIFLLGVDHCKDKKTGYDHFWQYFPKEKRPRQIKPAQGPFHIQEKVFPINNMAYEALRGFAECNNVKIHNCNPYSNVNSFEKITFQEIKKLL
jgi:hypothetical protein